jgi:hypothetical protein
MKKFFTSCIFIGFSFFNSPAYADGLDTFQQESNMIWSPDDQGATDSSENAKIATSMIAWGVGLAVIIALVFGLLNSYPTPKPTGTVTGQ